MQKISYTERVAIMAALNIRLSQIDEEIKLCQKLNNEESVTYWSNERQTLSDAFNKFTDLAITQ
jgi:hypothetical protein